MRTAGTADLLPARENPRKRSGMHARKTPLTCAASLRNRTVDLLLTMDTQCVAVTAAEALSRPYAGSHEQSSARTSPHWRHFAPRSAPHVDLRAAGRDQPSPAIRPIDHA